MSASDKDLWPEPEPKIIPVPDVLFNCSYGEGFGIPIIEYWSSGPSLVELDAYGDFAPERSDPFESADDDYYRQSTTACCPRQTIPDSCSCFENCQCMCTDCICENWGEEYED